MNIVDGKLVHVPGEGFSDGEFSSYQHRYGGGDPADVEITVRQPVDLDAVGTQLTAAVDGRLVVYLQRNTECSEVYGDQLPLTCVQFLTLGLKWFRQAVANVVTDKDVAMVKSDIEQFVKGLRVIRIGQNSVWISCLEVESQKTCEA